MKEQRPRLWIKLRHAVSQTAPELFGRAIMHPGGEWIEIRGPVGYPGEELWYGGRADDKWSFWENGDIDLAPIFDGADVERVFVEPGHKFAERLRVSSGATATFEVVVAEGPPAGVRS